MKKQLLQFIGTMIPVLLGVYLAIVAGNYNESVQQHRKLDRIEASLREEVATNLEAVQLSLDYHYDLRDSLTALRTRYTEEGLSQLPPREVLSFFRGTRPATIRHSAYQAGLATGLYPDMELELLMSISDLYIRQENYASLTRSYLQQALGLTADDMDGFEAVLFLSFFVNDVIPAEEALLRQMTEVEDFFKREGGTTD